MTASTVRPAAAVPQVRRMNFDFADDIPRHWWGGDRELTRNADALHLLFPEGERFFMRSVRDVAAKLTDPHLKARVRGFMGQEAMHGRETEVSFRLLERDGLEWESFVEAVIKPTFASADRHLSPMTRLSITCALEHLTATLGEGAFSDPTVVEAHPTMQKLMLWHAAEEVEHKSVAFDVFQAAGGGYFRRIVGMVLGYTTFMVLWRRAARHLLEQDGGYHARDMTALRARMQAKGNDRLAEFRAAFLGYLRPGFHPDDNDNLHIAEAYFAEQDRLAS